MELSREPIKAKAHGEIDYALSAVNATVPLLLGLNGPALAIPLSFAATQGAVNALTRTPVGLKPLISLRTHGWIEAATIPALAVLSIKSGALSSTRAKAYFGAIGLVLATVYGLTDWEASANS